MLDLDANYPRNNSKLPSVHQKCFTTELERCPIVQGSTEEEAQLIMRRLMDAFLERRLMRHFSTPAPSDWS
jgi:hypothetical protein